MEIKRKQGEQPSMFSNKIATLFFLIKDQISEQIAFVEARENFKIIKDINLIRRYREVALLTQQEEKKIEKLIINIKNNELSFRLVEKNYHTDQNQSITNSIISSITTVANYYLLEEEDFDKGMIRSELEKYVETCNLSPEVAALFHVCLNNILAKEITDLIQEVLLIYVKPNSSGFMLI